MTSRGGMRRRQIRLAAAGVWLLVLASDGATHARPEEVSAPNAAARPHHPLPGVVKSLSESGVGFLPIPLRSMTSYLGFAAPSTRPSPRRGEGDDVSLAPGLQEQPGHFFPPRPHGERVPEGRVRGRTTSSYHRASGKPSRSATSSPVEPIHS